MANAKNTIQNIPLTGELCLNTLKTDVKAFEGYNEKNSTVFGGELSPVWKKESELGDKENSFTIFNSKGEPFTLKLHNPTSAEPTIYPGIYDKDNNSIGFLRTPIELEDCAPENALWYTFLTRGNLGSSDFMFGQMYITRSEAYAFDVYARFSVNKGISTLLNTEYKKILRFSVDYHYYVDEIKSVDVKLVSIGDKDALLISIIYKCLDDTRYKYGFYSGMIYGDNLNTEYAPWNPDYDMKTHELTGILPNNFTETSFTTITYGSSWVFSYVPFTGRKTPEDTDKAKLVTFTYTDWESPITQTDEDQYYFYGTNAISTLNSNIVSSRLYPETVAEDAIYTVEVWKGGSYLVTKRANSNSVELNRWHTGHDGNYFIPGLKPGYLRTSDYNVFSDAYINGTLFAATFMGRLLRSPGVLDDFSYSKDNFAVSYKENDKWYSYVDSDSYLMFDYQVDMPILIKSFKKLSIIDNTYIQLNREHFYNIETKEKIKTHLDFMNYYVPTAGIGNDANTGIIYALGNNVNYSISNNPLIGLLYNPIVLTGYPSTDHASFIEYLRNYHLRAWELSEELRDIDFFYTIGDSVQSAEYQGTNPEYLGTLYPIDSNGNIIYPITWDSQIINGYSNNDLMKVGDTAYPLIYWNNNQKMYAYYLLSSMENVKGAFSLQGQQYTFDDKNIYNVTFDNGVIQNVTAVCYIKNMQFLGTLPTSAVFYSKFNKTFYQFTGDAILSKMFEASDIDEIKMVGQNPSTLSLWICTDKGVYILSDTDMFKLDYDVSDIYFEESKTILITEGETNWIENDISLYDIGNGATETPIKLQTKFYGLGGELKANYDCWYIRLHDKDRKTGKLKLKVNTITNSSFETEEKTFTIEPNQYDSNNTVYIRYQPKYQTAVATQLELESDIAIYQLSLGVNQNDAVAQQSKLNF